MTLRSVFLEELTSRNVEEYLRYDDTILVPLGSTEIHGAHAPLGTDNIIPREVCRRVAERRRWLVGPNIPYGIAAGWKGKEGTAYLTSDTFVRVIRDLCRSLTEGGFRHVVFVNGHLPNHRPVVTACLEVSDDLPEGSVCYGISYWDGLAPEQLEDFLSLRAGLHANIGETSVVMAIRPELVDLKYAIAHWPDIPQINARAVLDAIFETRIGGSIGVAPLGVWGDPTNSSPESGEQYLNQIVDGLDRLLQETRRVARAAGYFRRGGELGVNTD